MAIPALPSTKDMIEAGVHFGHAAGKWHPKMAPYIFCTRDHLHIIDLEKTSEQLARVLPVLEDRVRSGKSIVIVGTKKQVAPMIKEMGERLGLSYVSTRWLGGTLTNFTQMMQSISRMKKAEETLAGEDVHKMIKKERVMLQSELKRMHVKFGGLRDFKKKPDVMVVIDPSHEHIAIKEARVQGNVEIFALADTTTNPDLVDHIIPANDDGAKSLKMMLALIEETIANGQKMISVSEPVVEKVADVAIDVTVLDEIEAKLDDKQMKEKAAANAAREEREAKKALKEAAAEAEEVVEAVTETE
jgi:small subunit ribosomal protein S2